jgi:hypothetical protein
VGFGGGPCREGVSSISVILRRRGRRRYVGTFTTEGVSQYEIG